MLTHYADLPLDSPRLIPLPRNHNTPSLFSSELSVPLMTAMADFTQNDRDALEYEKAHLVIRMFLSDDASAALTALTSAERERIAPFIGGLWSRATVADYITVRRSLVAHLPVEPEPRPALAPSGTKRYRHDRSARMTRRLNYGAARQQVQKLWPEDDYDQQMSGPSRGNLWLTQWYAALVTSQQHRVPSLGERRAFAQGCTHMLHDALLRFDWAGNDTTIFNSLWREMAWRCYTSTAAYGRWLTTGNMPLQAVIISAQAMQSDLSTLVQQGGYPAVQAWYSTRQQKHHTVQHHTGDRDNDD